MVGGSGASRLAVVPHAETLTATSSATARRTITEAGRRKSFGDSLDRLGVIWAFYYHQLCTSFLCV
jgi:hypothetical protein